MITLLDTVTLNTFDEFNNKLDKVLKPFNDLNATLPDFNEFTKKAFPKVGEISPYYEVIHNLHWVNS
ncbi:MAG: hypothetical protein E7F68_06325 [Clostridium butyricum]|nr:hypothetical protein [Clostridium butyricum]MDU3594700.1 hypothetical protein [Clostridium butyricum]